jgi:hypothetical protein
MLKQEAAPVQAPPIDFYFRSLFPPSTAIPHTIYPTVVPDIANSLGDA